MTPLLFFRMLEKGRLIAKRKAFRDYYQLCRVNTVHLMKPEDRNQIMSYYWDGSLNDIERAAQARVVAQAKADASKTWLPPSAALDFFRKR